MTWCEIPVEPDKYAPDDIEVFASALQSSTGTVLGYCRTGKRAIHLWAYGSVARFPVTYLLSKAGAAGFDLEPLRDDLETYRGRVGSDHQ